MFIERLTLNWYKAHLWATGSNISFLWSYRIHHAQRAINISPLRGFDPLLFILPFFDFLRSLWMFQVSLSVLTLLGNYFALLQSPFQSYLHEI